MSNKRREVKGYPQPMTTIQTKQKNKLVLTGPVDVRPEILEAQAQGMIGHRGKAFEELYASMQTNLRRAFFTENRVYTVATSGTGFWEAASRNCIRDENKVLHLTGGSFSERWASISEANGKQVVTLPVEWGKAHTPEMVAEALSQDTYDAVCVVHNETSTGLTNPIAAIGEVVRQYDDTFFLVDTVSGVLGTELRVDDWGIDVALASSQKAFALPPGLAFAAVSDRVLDRAKTITNRGYYFDFVEMEKYLLKNNTPSTPPITLMYAADQQLKDVMEEGMENRWQRHIDLKETTHRWLEARGFGYFAEEGYRSNTVTCVANTRGIDVFAMAAFMSERGYTIDKGYGKIKGETFRIGHMGDMQPDFLDAVLSTMDDYLNTL